MEALEGTAGKKRSNGRSGGATRLAASGVSRSKHRPARGRQAKGKGRDQQGENLHVEERRHGSHGRLEKLDARGVGEKRSEDCGARDKSSAGEVASASWEKKELAGVGHAWPPFFSPLFGSVWKAAE